MWAVLSPILVILAKIVGFIIDAKVKKGELEQEANENFLDFLDGLESSLNGTAKLRDEAQGQREELDNPKE